MHLTQKTTFQVHDVSQFFIQGILYNYWNIVSMIEWVELSVSVSYENLLPFSFSFFCTEVSHTYWKDKNQHV